MPESGILYRRLVLFIYRRPDSGTKTFRDNKIAIVIARLDLLFCLPSFHQTKYWSQHLGITAIDRLQLLGSSCLGILELCLKNLNFRISSSGLSSPFTCLVSNKELAQLVKDKTSQQREVVVINGKQELEKGNRCLMTI